MVSVRVGGRRPQALAQLVSADLEVCDLQAVITSIVSTLGFAMWKHMTGI